MKSSRIASILLVADRRCTEIIDALPAGRSKANAEAVNLICKALVKRRVPLLPSAGLVAEEGRKNNQQFAAEQTIYNRYAQILRLWRVAYHDVMNIETDGPITTDHVSKIDTSTMEVSTANIVDRLKEIIFELNQRNNVLKQIIDNNVPMPADDFPSASGYDDVVLELGKWLRSLADNPAFQLDEIGLKISRKTPFGTRIIDVDLLEKLISFTTDFARIRKARAATS